MTDATTFFLSFLSVFGGLGYYLWRMERRVTALQAKAEATTAKKQG
ncbi:MAG: hypothetical protein ACPHID_00400 [Thermoplasmatota archaeon]